MPLPAASTLSPTPRHLECPQHAARGLEAARWGLEWSVRMVLGANPFSRSLMFGAGYDYWKNFAVSMPNLVGGLSLGFNSYSGDSPAWPNNTVFPYKEMWVFSSSRVVLTLAHVGIPARLHGSTAQDAVLRERRTGVETTLRAGRFDISLPAGEYDVHCGSIERTISLTDGATRRLVLDPHQFAELDLTASSPVKGALTLTLRARGAGTHTVEIQSSNLEVAEPRQRLSLRRRSAQTLTRTARILDPQRPWVAVLVPNRALDKKVELFGTAISLRKLA